MCLVTMADDEVLFDDVYELGEVIGKWVHILISYILLGIYIFIYIVCAGDEFMRWVGREQDYLIRLFYRSGSGDGSGWKTIGWLGYVGDGDGDGDGSGGSLGSLHAALVELSGN